MSLHMCVGEWSFKEKGFTAIGSPESIQKGTTHGVYVPENMDDLRRSYKKGMYIITVSLYLSML